MLFLIAKSSYSNCGGGEGHCIPANDFGTGSTLCIPANPDAFNTSGTNLVRSMPKDQQIAPWVDSGVFTKGDPVDPLDQSSAALMISISGSWYPWGKLNNIKRCDMFGCDPNKEGHKICWPKGMVVDDSKDSNGDSNIPCYLTNGWGLYGLIALIQNDGSYADPNILSNATILPYSLFRTFRIDPIDDKGNNQSGEDKEIYYKLKYTQQCDEFGCKKDIHKEGGEYVMRGRLFFKILDKHYEDNDGEYLVNVISGVYTEKGIIEHAINVIEDHITKISEKLRNTITKDIKLITMVKVLLSLYVMFTAVGFVMGVIKIQQGELVMRFVKVALISTLISDTGWDFFDTYLFALIKNVAKDVSSMFIKATLFYEDGRPIYHMPNTATPLTVYDTILKILTSTPIHAKTWSLLFYQWKLYWIPCFYTGFIFIIVAVLRSVVIYAMIVMQWAILMLVAPIFVPMVLFKWTKELFDTWLKQLISSAMLYLLLSAGVALMMRIVFGQLTDLLSYKVCWESIWKLRILGATIIDLKFWNPSSSTELLNSVTPINFLAFIIMAIVFYNFVQNIPQLSDVLSGSPRMPSSSMQSSVEGEFNESFVGKVGASLKKEIAQHNPIGKAIDSNKVTRAAVDVFHKAGNVTDNVDKKLKG
ncbi:TrbL/VirB6 family protein [Candidatus Cyrtobacter comes]|uniref:type IV secretion system protein n=1 Tax=Candidatus Cyrtobacter comes TaxID=675776 RepID=UPI002ACEB76A|nr:type IV secretion system protein [Candidatus Cyrtobacter comes]